jgi:hypothetical protein
MSITFKNAYVHCVATIQEDVVVLNGQITDMDKYSQVEVVAPNPIDRMINYSGSGLPFPCAQIAFEGTPNYTLVTSKDGIFKTTFKYPNSYYTNDAVTKVLPSVFFIMRGNADPVYLRFELPERDEILNVRTLTHRPLHTGPEFYSTKEDIIGICGAEETMRKLKDVKIAKGLA